MMEAIRSRILSPATHQSATSDTLLPQQRNRTVAMVVIGVVVYNVAETAGRLSAGAAGAAWVAAGVFSLTFLLGVYRVVPLAVLLCGLSGTAIQLLMPSVIAFLMAICAVTQATRLDEMRARPIAVLVGAAYLAAVVHTSHVLSLGDLFSPAIGLFFAYVATRSFRGLREEKRKTEALLQEVLAGRDAQVRAVALDERARLAREIHDILAHTLSALSVQLESARLLVEQRPGDPATVAVVERAGRLAREGLDETRRAVSALRDEALPGPEALPRLVADWASDSDIPCRFTMEGEPLALSPDARLALYRTAQEALTNIRKHARATEAEVQLRYTPQGVELRVENRGDVRHPPSGGGYGLRGMRERAELARGTLEAGPTAGGFLVRLWLPA